MQETRKVFFGVREASTSTGIAIDTLLRARAHTDSPKGIVGFHESSRVYWNIPDEKGMTLEKWISEHLPELESVTGEESKSYWDTRYARARALNEELELEEKYKRIVNKQDIVELLDRIASAQVSLFNSRLRQELPARWNLPPEKIAELDAVIKEIFDVMTKGVASWR